MFISCPSWSGLQIHNILCVVSQIDNISCVVYVNTKIFMCFYCPFFFFPSLSLPALGHGVMACRLVSLFFQSCYRFSLGFQLIGFPVVLVSLGFQCCYRFSCCIGQLRFLVLQIFLLYWLAWDFSVVLGFLVGQLGFLVVLQVFLLCCLAWLFSVVIGFPIA